jgi:4-hydroxythreonine-4-phosphate dehydrogenase
MVDRPAIAITAGEPAGIGPELITMLAARHRERPWSARLVVFGDRNVLVARSMP